MTDSQQTCPFRAAVEIMGGEALLREKAKSRALWSIWHHQGVPWRIVGPRLLHLWREATESKGLIPVSAVMHLTDAILKESKELRAFTKTRSRTMKRALQLLRQKKRL